MKKALITGGGSKFGLKLTKRLVENGYHVDMITSSKIKHTKIFPYTVNWFDLTEKTLDDALSRFGKDKYDLIIFNHNTGGGPNETDYLPYTDVDLDMWNLHYFINCQVPFLILKKLKNKISNDTKIVWMITGLVDGKWKDGWKYGGYSGFKSTNIFLMRGFSKYFPGIFFGINPGHLTKENYDEYSKKTMETILTQTKESSGKLLTQAGDEWFF